MAKECLKTLGIVSNGSECPAECGVMQIVNEKIRSDGDGSRTKMEQIAKRISQGYCPSATEMVLRRTSRTLVW